jgi:putative methanogenesis marker protein 8
MKQLSIEDIIERSHRTFLHIGEDFVLIEDSPIKCPFIRVRNWKEAWMALYLRKLKFGQFTEDRKVLDFNKYVPFGASEIIMEALKADLLDAAVLVCDGAGTVITSAPEIVQGVGGRMSGLMYTKPRENVIGRLQREDAIVLDAETARIDALNGAKRALKTYKRIAVTVTASEEVEELKRLSPNITVFVVHTTGITPEQAEYARKGDIVWGCASKHTREIVGPHALVQLGVGIPVFVLTERGLNLTVPQINELSSKIGNVLEKSIFDIQSGARYLIHHRRTLNTGIELVMRKCALPVLRARGPHPLI